MNYDEALAYLLSLGHETVALKLGLANTTRLLEILGNPHRSYPSVQIAGTNGKGSTAAMLSAICRAAGIKAGLYTSPHLVSITERIRFGDEEISPESFSFWVTRVREAALQVKRETGALPTFFEHLTAVALVAFQDAQVELAILETGLGGRLDSTTAVGARLLAITPVSLDHQEYLGNTLGEIANEKAAIIHSGSTVVVAPQTTEALDVILRRCALCNVTPVRPPVPEIAGCSSKGHLRVRLISGEEANLALPGRHQAVNASVAVALATELSRNVFKVPPRAIALGLGRAKHPGRLQWLPGSPPILLDGAHNVSGAQALRAYLEEFVHAPVTFVFGAMREKDLAGIESVLFPGANLVIFTCPNNPRAASLDEMANQLSDSGLDAKPFLFELPSEALRQAHSMTPADGVICVTGSLYLVGEILRHQKNVIPLQ